MSPKRILNVDLSDIYLGVQNFFHRFYTLTVCDTSSVHCLMQIFTSFFFIFWCLHASVYVTSEKPSNDKPSLKDLESLFDSKLKPIHSRLDDLFKKVDDNYKALQARLDSLEARNASLEAENANLE